MFRISLFYFVTKTMKKIKILKDLTAEETLIGKGAVLYIEKATSPLIHLLRKKYIEDPGCITGDIKFLFTFEGSEIDDDCEDILESYERLWRIIKPPTQTAEQNSSPCKKLSDSK